MKRMLGEVDDIDMCTAIGRMIHQADAGSHQGFHFQSLKSAREPISVNAIKVYACQGGGGKRGGWHDIFNRKSKESCPHPEVAYYGHSVFNKTLSNEPCKFSIPLGHPTEE